MFGWTLWAACVALSWAAGYVCAAGLYRHRGLAHRLAVASLVQLAAILAPTQLLGALNHYSRWPVVAGTLIASVIAAWMGLSKIGLAGLRDCIARDLDSPRRWTAEWRPLQVAWLGVLIPAFAALGMTLLMVVYLRTWSWDSAYYHQPAAAYTIQNHGFKWIETNVTWLGYPKNVELIAAWNCVLSGVTRLDDAPQIPFLLFGMLLIVAWARELGCSRSLAAAVGGALVTVPPVLVQASSNENDIACGALLAAAFYFQRGRPSAADRWCTLSALGIYLGSKYTGAFHALLLAPWVLARMGWELVQAHRRVRTGINIIASGLFALGLGLFKYVQNFLHTGNPLWPVRSDLPFGIHLDGPEDATTMSYHGVTSYFFHLPGDFTRMIDSWLETPGAYEPNTHSGAFGPLFWVMLPCLAAAAVDVVRGHRSRERLPVVLLFLAAIVVPGAWWPRYTMGGAFAGLVAIGMIASEIPTTLLQLASAMLLAMLSWRGYSNVRATLAGGPSTLSRAIHLGPVESDFMVVDRRVNWPENWAHRLQTALGPGDVITYDEGGYFLSELFTNDLHNRVEYVPVRDAPEGYPARLRSHHAQWALVRRSSALAGAMKDAGFTKLFGTDVEDVYEATSSQ